MRIERIPHRGESPEGTNSAYLLPGQGLLVDPGPPGGEAWDDLTAGITGAGLDIADVDHVFVTHWHVDHAGLAVRLAETADATVSMHRTDAPLVGDYTRERQRRLARDADRLESWGVPTDLITAQREEDTPSPLPETYPVEDRSDGDTVAGLTVVHTPGHTAGHASLANASTGDLIVGDAVLPTYTPNVGGGDTRLTDPLSTYLTTLDRLEGCGWTTADASDVRLHPGHGSTVGFPARIEAIRRHHEARKSRVLEVLEGSAPATPWTVATALFGELRNLHVKMGAGEAAAHLVRLERAGRIDRVGWSPDRYVCRDEATERPPDRSGQ